MIVVRRVPASLWRAFTMALRLAAAAKMTAAHEPKIIATMAAGMTWI